MLSQAPANLSEARLQAHAIYILTRNDVVTTNYLTNLQLYLDKEHANAWKQDITGAYIASTYSLLKSQNEANSLISQYAVQTQGKHEDLGFYDHNIANAEYLYLVARHFPEKLKSVSDKLTLSLVAALNNDEINTILSAYTSLAFSVMSANNTDAGTGFSMLAILTDNSEKNLLTLVNSYGKASIDEGVKGVVFNNLNQKTYFYQLTEAGFDKTLPKEGIQQGLEVHREYRDAKGNVVGSVTLGSEIEVHIQARSQNHYLYNIAIVDLLPGGFEVVADSVKNEDMDYIDVREDRVVFFGGVDARAREIVYRIKATNTGKFMVPPILAESMYDPGIKAREVAGTMIVTAP